MGLKAAAAAAVAVTAAHHGGPAAARLRRRAPGRPGRHDVQPPLRGTVVDPTRLGRPPPGDARTAAPRAPARHRHPGRASTGKCATSRTTSARTTTGSAPAARAAARTSSWRSSTTPADWRPIEYDHFWLSDTPYMIASNTWGADSLRMVTWVRFRRSRRRRPGVLRPQHPPRQRQPVRTRTRAAALIAQTDRRVRPVVTGHRDRRLQRRRPRQPGVRHHAGQRAGRHLGRGGRAGRAVRDLPRLPAAHGPTGDRIDWILATPGVTDAPGLDEHLHAWTGSSRATTCRCRPRLTLG